MSRPTHLQIDILFSDGGDYVPLSDVFYLFFGEQTSFAKYGDILLPPPDMKVYNLLGKVAVVLAAISAWFLYNTLGIKAGFAYLSSYSIVKKWEVLSSAQDESELVRAVQNTDKDNIFLLNGKKLPEHICIQDRLYRFKGMLPQPFVADLDRTLNMVDTDDVIFGGFVYTPRQMG